MPAEISYARRICSRLHVSKVLIEIVVYVCVVLLCQCKRVLVRRVCLKNVLEKFACSRLTSFRHPVPGYDRVTIWSPDAIDKHRIRRHYQVTCGGASYCGKTGESL